MSSRRSRTSLAEEISKIVFTLLCIAGSGWLYVHVILPQQMAQIKALSALPAKNASLH